MYRQGEVSVLSLDAYAALVADSLELLPPDTIIMRLMGDAPHGMLIAPLWSQDKRAALNRIEQELERRDIHQGSAYH
jgi:radical SAM superfamily enzyme